MIFSRHVSKSNLFLTKLYLLCYINESNSIKKFHTYTPKQIWRYADASTIREIQPCESLVPNHETIRLHLIGNLFERDTGIRTKT